MKNFCRFFSIFFLFFLISCSPKEMTLLEIEEYLRSSNSQLIRSSVSKPWKNQKIVPGKVKGIWYDTILADPKTFNQLIAERDGSSAAILDNVLDCLVDYDMENKKWFSRLADFEIETDEKNDTLTVHYTIKEGIVWSYYNSDKKIPVTSDDFVFWYNEIAGDSRFNSSGFSGQWISMSDGSLKRVECVKIDERRFDFIFPRIIAEPLLSTNMNLCPSFLYKKAKEEGGVEGVKNLFPANCDVKQIPSCGKWFITEYIPSQRLVLERNPSYWEKDSENVSIPYVEKKVFQITGDMSTDFLLFREGKTEVFMPRPEEISDVVKNQKDDYTVFNSEGSMSASLWSFNQNPINKNQKFYKWFCTKEFRQAMSSLLNRERIIDQAYRGLASAKYDFFPEINPYYNPEITLKYRYDLEKAENLLLSAGFKRTQDGVMRDSDGFAVEFDVTIPSSNTVFNDIALIISDECSKVGIKVNVRQVDFQKIIEMLTSTYDWQSVLIGLGSNAFPTQGSNVWPSSGNLHLWNPLQKTPQTEWEARIDYLYNEGSFTLEREKAFVIWDEYQRIILEQCPVIYLLRPKSFVAMRNRWDFSNVYFDNMNGLKIDFVFLKD